MIDPYCASKGKYSVQPEYAPVVEDHEVRQSFLQDAFRCRGLLDQKVESLQKRLTIDRNDAEELWELFQSFIGHTLERRSELTAAPPDLPARRQHGRTSQRKRQTNPGKGSRLRGQQISMKPLAPYPSSTYTMPESVTGPPLSWSGLTVSTMSTAPETAEISQATAAHERLDSEMTDESPSQKAALHPLDSDKGKEKAIQPWPELGFVVETPDYNSTSLSGCLGTLSPGLDPFCDNCIADPANCSLDHPMLASEPLLDLSWLERM